jgi:hypothetical protein
MPGTSYESAPTPTSSFPALRLKTPPPGARSTGVCDQLGRMLARARATDAVLRDLNAMADEALALLEAEPRP